MTAAVGVEGEAGEPGMTMAPGRAGGHGAAGAPAGSSAGGGRGGGGTGGGRDAPSGYEWVADLLGACRTDTYMTCPSFQMHIVD